MAGSGIDGPPGIDVSGGRLHRFGSSDSDMELLSAGGRKSGLDPNNTGAGDGSFPLIG